uniref:Uncharacterized protein n=1 Tax=Anguilla anguilla TaxID=7936 RepID=A0A0E9V3N3_ANGAN
MQIASCITKFTFEFYSFEGSV